VNTIDILFLLVLAAGAWKGWTNGLLKEVLGLIGIFVGLYVAHLLYGRVGAYIAPEIGCSPSIANILAFALIWIGVPVLLGIAGSLLTKMLEWIGLDSVNNIGGALLSLVKYAFILGLCCNVLSITRLVGEQTQKDSFLFEPLKSTTSIAFNLAKSQWQNIKLEEDE